MNIILLLDPIFESSLIKIPPMKLLASKIERTIQNFYIKLQSKGSGVNRIFNAHVV